MLTEPTKTSAYNTTIVDCTVDRCATSIFYNSLNRAWRNGSHNMNPKIQKSINYFTSKNLLALSDLFNATFTVKIRVCPTHTTKDALVLRGILLALAFQCVDNVVLIAPTSHFTTLVTNENVLCFKTYFQLKIFLSSLAQPMST